MNFLGPLTVAGIVLLSGGPIAAALAALVGAGLGGAAIKEVLDRYTANRHSAAFAAALEAGAVLLWVRVGRPRARGGRHPHPHRGGRAHYAYPHPESLTPPAKIFPPALIRADSATVLNDGPCRVSPATIPPLAPLRRGFLFARGAVRSLESAAMAYGETRAARARGRGGWRIALPRLLAGALILSLPAFAVLAVLAWRRTLPLAPAVAAAALIYAGIVLVLRPLTFGVAAVQAAIESMTQDAAAAPEVESLSFSVRELWLAVGRWTRSTRALLKSREDELEAARSVLEALPEPLLLLDADRRVVGANKAAEALLGEHLLERDLAGALRHPAVLPAVDAVLRGEGQRTAEFDITSPVELHLSARIAPLAPRRSERAAAVLLLNDLTAMKRAEQLRADFVANASHELRTPLASLVGFIETLRGPARDDKAAGQRFLGIMAEQAARMQRLVDDLLSLSRIEMNEHRPPTAATDLGTLVASVAAALEPRAEARGMRIDARSCRATQP